MTTPHLPPTEAALLYYDDTTEPIDEVALLQELIAWAAPIIARVATAPKHEHQTGRRAA